MILYYNLHTGVSVMIDCLSNVREKRHHSPANSDGYQGMQLTAVYAVRGGTTANITVLGSLLCIFELVNRNSSLPPSPTLRLELRVDQLIPLKFVGKGGGGW